MDLGFFTMPIHPLGRNVTETLMEDKELAVVADRLGFTEGFYGEHITDAAETWTCPDKVESFPEMKGELDDQA
jgi:hypothetical protein